MGRRRRRRHGAEFKTAVIHECLKPGVSIAAFALAHSLNANMLRKWVIDAEHKGAAPVTAAKLSAPELPARVKLVVASFMLPTAVYRRTANAS